MIGVISALSTVIVVALTTRLSFLAVHRHFKAMAEDKKSKGGIRR